MPTVKEMTKRLKKLRKERDNGRVKDTLAQFRAAAAGDGYLMPIMVDAAKALCTTSEIFGILKQVLGEDHSCLIPPDWAKGA
jgi:methylmalonyl-CoA mutase N-terminal domain/subunit